MAKITNVLNAQELKSKLFTKLKREGKLDTLRASMRSEVVKCFYSQGLEKKGNSQSNGGIELAVLNWLIDDHLVRNQYEFTRSIFNLERGISTLKQQLNITEVFSHLGIQLSSNLGTKSIAAFMDPGNNLFLWDLLQTAKHNNSLIQSEETKKPDIQNRTLEKNDISRDLRHKLKGIDEIYDKMLTSITNQSIISKCDQRNDKHLIPHVGNRYDGDNLKSTNESLNTHVLENLIPDVELPQNKAIRLSTYVMQNTPGHDLLSADKDVYLREKGNRDITACKQELNLHLDKQRLLLDNLELREKQLATDCENVKIERYDLERKKKEIDNRYLDLNRFQQRLEDRQSQLEFRERQHNQSLFEIKKLKDELKRCFDYGETNHVARLRNEYEGKVIDAMSQVQYLQNKLLSVEGIRKLDKMKHEQQTIFLHEQSKLQRERITFLQGYVRELQTQLSPQNIQIWSNSIYSFSEEVKKPEMTFGADLQETYFDTSLNASHLAPELELGKQLETTSELPTFGDISTIRSRIRELESEADHLEFSYSKLEKTDFEDNREFIVDQQSLISPVFNDTRKKYKNPQVTFQDNFYKENDEAIDGMVSQPYESIQKTFPRTPISALNTENKQLNAKLAETYKIDETFDTKMNSLEDNQQVATKLEEDKTAGVEKLNSLHYTLVSTLDNSRPEILDIGNTPLKLPSPVLSLISDKSENKENLNESEYSSRLSQRSSTPIQSLSAPISLNQNDNINEIEEVENVKDAISWEKVSSGSNNEFEW